ncbi:hypothetical protein QC281_45825, partial [Streptomyces sp. DH17]|nr:hypothetical protein [Streptomyces sp. DH17]
MSEDVKDAGLVAMISSILGGNKRADTIAPPPLTEVPPTAPTNGFEQVAADIPDQAAAKSGNAPAGNAPNTAPSAAPAATRPVEKPVE